MHRVHITGTLCFQVPGLFEGDEFTTLMTQCKEGSQRDGLLLDSSEELYKWFTDQVSDHCCRHCSQEAVRLIEGEGVCVDWLLQDAPLKLFHEGGV